MNLIYIKAVPKGRTINYEFELLGEWKSVFNLSPFSGGLAKTYGKNNFQIDSYPCEISDVPNNILIIPFICNILPIAWLYNATIICEEIDYEFYLCLDRLRDAYQRLYPSLPLINEKVGERGGGVVADKKIRNYIDKPAAGPLILYSGGVDATFTLLSHLKLSPTIVCIRGSDIYFGEGDDKAWEVTSKLNRDIANNFNVSYLEIESTFKTFPKAWVLNEKIKSIKDNYWHGIQHGPALIGLAAPLAWKLKSERVIISSSFSYKDRVQGKGSSMPSTDEQIRFFGLNTLHYDYSVSRQDKVSYICQQAEFLKVDVPLRVCWESRTGINCCVCEKCMRTIFGIYAEDKDPSNFNFNLTENLVNEIIVKLSDPNLKRSVAWHGIIEKLSTSKYKDLREVIAALKINL